MPTISTQLTTVRWPKLATLAGLVAVLGLAPLACDLDNDLDNGDDAAHEDHELRKGPPWQQLGLGYNLHLSTRHHIHHPQPTADPEHGRKLFGLAANLIDEDSSEALFEGYSAAAGYEIVSNGRSCFTCHRGSEDGFGLPPPPLSDHIDLSDPLFTGIDGDAQGDPDAFANLDQHALFKYRLHRFDPRKSADDPFSQIITWRKSPQVFNVALQNGFLNDQRGRVLTEVARGAVMVHTQESDDRFDDLFSESDGRDIEAFLFTLFTDPELEILRDPNHPRYAEMMADPYSTVAITTQAQARGRAVFDRYCFSCHNMPHVFSGLDNVEPLASGERPPEAPSWAPSIGRTYNIGIAERNKYGLCFTCFVGPGQFEPVVVPLAREDGSIEQHEVKFDIGLAMTTGRSVDVGRFKVPQLRKLASKTPYFHDNSMTTLAEVVDYFNSDEYNNSADGRRYPIKLSAKQRADLLEFLKIL